MSNEISNQLEKVLNTNSSNRFFEIMVHIFLGKFHSWMRSTRLTGYPKKLSCYFLESALLTESQFYFSFL